MQLSVAVRQSRRWLRGHIERRRCSSEDIVFPDQCVAHAKHAAPDKSQRLIAGACRCNVPGERWGRGGNWGQVHVGRHPELAGERLQHRQLRRSILCSRDMVSVSTSNLDTSHMNAT